MTIFLGFAQPAQAQSHPCVSTEPLQGILASGTPVLFKLEGSDQSYGVAGLALLGSDFAKLNFEPGTTLSVAVESNKPDRYGRLTGQVFSDGADNSKTWLQGDLLTNGLALFAGNASSPDCRTAMLKAEKAGQDQKHGIWAKGETEFSAENIQQLEAKSGHFAIINGKVLSVGNRKTRLYLNFGKKWSQDFTALIAKKGKSAFKGDLEKLTRLKGANVRVRGIVEISGGPMIRVTNEAQIEIDGQ